MMLHTLSVVLNKISWSSEILKEHYAQYWEQFILEATLLVKYVK